MVEAKEFVVKSIVRDLPAWGISLFVNLGILIPLHFIIREVTARKDVTEISSVIEDIQEEQYRFTEVAEDVIGTQGDSLSITPASLQATHVGRNESKPERRIEQSLLPAPAPLEAPIEIPQESDITSVVEVSGETTDVTQQGVEGALDHIAYEIAASRRERQTLVIWLFDASQSLNERRNDIADRFDTVYKQLGQLEDAQANDLHTAVCSFGERLTLMTPQPVTDVSEMVTAIRNIEPDESGKENVFSSLDLVMEKWKTFHRHEGRWNKLVFIVTDERGDDAPAKLEDSINVAKRYQFRCYVAGNAALFGQRKGAVLWTYEDGYQEWINDVDQGPETAFEHVIQLPFWGSGQVRLSAGYGPYALTRLASETGGMYLITHDGASEHFDQAVMREYKPDYRPVRVMEAELRTNPAKFALWQTAQQTYLNSVPLPTLVFSAENDNQLRQEITDAQRPIAETEHWVDRMYNMLLQGAKARDTISDRAWQASFDLAMGRLLAMKVRLRGYNLMLAQMKSTPQTFAKPGSNEWRLVASTEIDTGPRMRQAGEEARELLKGVIDEHPDTPWERLAVKELGQDLGWKWQEGMHYVAGMENRTDIDQDRVRLLLAEQMRRQERQQQAAKPREKPKL